MIKFYYVFIQNIKSVESITNIMRIIDQCLKVVEVGEYI